MAKKALNKSVATVTKKVPKRHINTSTPAETSPTENTSAMNEPERQSAKEADEVAVSEATTKRLNLLLGIVSQKFNLDDTYRVCQFNDKGKVMNITLENDDFSVAVTVKDSERHGLVVEQ